MHFATIRPGFVVRGWRMSRRLLVSGVAIVTLIGSAAPAFAARPSTNAAATVTALTMVSDPGDYIGGGLAREFDATNATISVNGSKSELDVSVNGGTSSDNYDFDLAPAPGTNFAIGYYTGA